MKHEFGRLSKANNGGTVVFERRFQQDVATVWDALTNPDKLAVWFMKVKMDFVPGGKMVLYFGDPDNTESYGKITRIEPNKVFEWIWENTDGPDELATWELFPDGQGTRLVFTYSQMSDEWMARASAGWTIMLGHLEEVLNGRTEPFPYTGGQSEQELEMVAAYEKLLKQL